MRESNTRPDEHQLATGRNAVRRRQLAKQLITWRGEMKTATAYEWSFQHIDSNGDIIDHEFTGALAEYPAWVRQLWDGGECDYADCTSHRLELWRNTWEDHFDWPDLLDRSYALVEEGALPMHTDDGSIVPKRFHREFMNWAKQQAKQEAR